MKITLKDVAKKAGVAKSTVSFVLNDKEYVSEKTRKKVLLAIKELNYHPNENARNLSRKQTISKKTNNIAFVTCNFAFNSTGPYYGKILTGVYEQVKRQKYRLTFANAKNNDNELPEGIEKNSIEGVILAGRPSKSFLKKITDSNIPFVLASFAFSDLHCNEVRADNIKGTIEGVTHLYNLGHRDIVYIAGDMNHPDTIEKLQGYKIAMQEFSLNFKDKIIISTYTPEGGKAGLNELQKRNIKYSAIVTGNDGIALGVYERAAELGIKIPDDISVIGFDGIEIGAYITPPLSTIAVDLESIGSMAVRHLLSIIEHKQNPVTIRVSTNLLIRKSVIKIS